MNVLEILDDKIQGKAVKGAKRSSQWGKVRRAHLKKYPTCRVCGSKKTLRVHHLIAFHIAPHLELEPRNLVTLCESSKTLNCHLVFGHLKNFRRTNPSCEVDVASWYIKLSTTGFALTDN